MPLSALSDRSAVAAAMAEFDRLGRAFFLTKYGFKPARTYFLVHEGRRYDSKALAGAAYGHQFPSEGPLAASAFSGGEATVKAKFESLGFEVEASSDTEPRNPDWTREETILALDVYVRRRPQLPGEDDAEIVELSDTLRRYAAQRGVATSATFRNPNGVSMKVGNLSRLDGDDERRGLPHGSKIEGTVWAEFMPDTARLHQAAKAIRATIASGADATGQAGPTLGEILGGDGRLFAKSEFGPVHDGWPALSFSSRKIASEFSAGFRRGRDFVLFVGTGDPNSTENPDHRRRVLSAVTFEPNAPISTEQIVSPEAWAEAIEKWGIRWEWSLPVIEAYDFEPYPEAHEVMPRTYARLGSLASLGRCVPVELEDLELLLALRVVRKPISVRPAVSQVLDMNPDNPDVRRAISQLALGIQQRIELSGQARVGHHPLRKGPNLSDIIAALNRNWVSQGGRCNLCDRPIPLNPQNRLLKMSPDRIDSLEKSYDPENVHLAHLGCNLAKNDASLEDWHGFLSILRDPLGAS